ncbi:hypothetical protein M434DRAFT_398702 [Hypoxylon sp. CO27-5]|nr:hypothetical protein M434DRAFT_398702 [Hypoxylon sp. CO27-5]
MSMDTFSLLDDENQSSLRDDLTLYEKYNTRLLRIDRELRARQDPFQRWIHRLLRSFRYWRLFKRLEGSQDRPGSHDAKRKWSYQDADLIASILSRLIVALSTAVFLLLPLTGLSHYQERRFQLVLITIWILIFPGFVAIMLRASNLEMMMVTAAYAAVLSVFLSNSPGN